MEVWIPLFQELIWPVFLLLVILFNRKWFSEVLEIIKVRIRDSEEVRIGDIVQLSGSVGAAVEGLETLDAPISPAEQAAPRRGEQKEVPIKKEEIEQAITLIHTAQRTNSLDSLGRPYYNITARLAATHPNILKEVKQVEYRLHETFPNPNRTVSSPNNDFALTITAWGQFNLRATVTFKDGRPPLELVRYLNF